MKHSDNGRLRPGGGYGRLVLDNDAFFADVEALLSGGHSVTVAAQGSSMVPFVAGGRDMVVLQRTSGVGVGDIVLARVPGHGYVLHRVYRTFGGELILMGDGNVERTELCRRGDVVGKAVRIVRRGRTIDCGSRTERLMAACWRRLLPLRRELLWVIRRL